jgi:hypothetical protein
VAQAPKQDDKQPHEHDEARRHEDEKNQALVQKQQQPRSPEENRRAYDELENVDWPITAQTDQLARSAKMERMGPTAYMEEENRRIQERQGQPPDEPRQVHGVAPAKKP